MEEVQQVQPKTWIELLSLEAPKDKKLAILRDDPRLAYSNPGPLRKNLWLSVIPESFVKAKQSEFVDLIDQVEKIDASLGPRTLDIINSHVKVVAQQYDIADEFKKEEITKIVKMYTFAASSLCYDAVWTYLSSAFALNFEPQDSYTFLAFAVEALYPEDYFSAKGIYHEKNAQFALFALYVGECAPGLVERLTCNKIILDCINCAEETQSSKEAFFTYCRKLGDAYFSKLFASQISCNLFLKFLDFLFLEGFKFVQKISVNTVKYLYYNSISTIRKTLNGVEKNEENLTVAAIVSTASLLKPIKDKKFLSLIRKAREDEALEKLFNEKGDQFTEEAHKLSTRTKNSVRDSRLARIVKLKHDFNDYGVDLSREQLLDYIVAFEKYVNDYKRFPGYVVPYDNFKKFFIKRYRWEINLINSLYVTIDSRLKGCVSAAEFGAVLILVSNLTSEDKLYLICSKLQPDDDGNISVQNGICLIDKLEEVVAYDLKGCRLNSGSIVSQVEQNYQDVEMVAFAAFVEYSRQLSETQHVFEVIDNIDPYYEKMKEARKDVKYDVDENENQGEGGKKEEKSISPNCFHFPYLVSFSNELPDEDMLPNLGLGDVSFKKLGDRICTTNESCLIF